MTSIHIHDVKLLTLDSSMDNRGVFVKTFNQSLFEAEGISFDLKESYFSLSRKNVIRGMHFQLPPYEHSKIVFCPKGAILDVIVDLRKNSPTYKQCFANELSSANHKAYYIPAGFAHGFKALTDNAMTYYLVSSEYSMPHDTGIHFDSIGFDWEVSSPILSERDMSFVSMDNFESPF